MKRWGVGWCGSERARAYVHACNVCERPRVCIHVCVRAWVGVWVVACRLLLTGKQVCVPEIGLQFAANWKILIFLLSENISDAGGWVGQLCRLGS